MCGMRFLVFFLMLVVSVFAERYADVKEFEEAVGKGYWEGRKLVRNVDTKFYWSADGGSLIFYEERADGGDYVRMDLESGEREVAFDLAAVRKAIEEAGGKFDLRDVRFGKDFLELRMRREGFWRGTDGKRVKRQKKDRRPGMPKAYGESPDGKWVVSLKDFNVVMQEKGKDGVMQVTSDGTAENFYGHVIWAPDSSRFCVLRTKVGQRREVTVVESSPNGQLQPKVHQWRYDKPGDEVDQTLPFIFYVDGREVLLPDAGLMPNLFSTRKFEWRGDGERMTYEYTERGYGKYYVMEIDSERREHRVLVREESETFIFVSGNGFRHDVNDGEEILWASERDGWNHVYLLDGKTGEVKNQVTRGEYVVFEVEKVDEERRRILFVAGGMKEGEDPYHRKWYWVNFDGSGLVELTPGEGTHSLDFSPDGELYVDKYSSLEKAPVYELRRSADGGLVKELLRADVSALRESGWRGPRVFKTTDRDGKFDVWGYVQLPNDFDPKKKYPVLEHIYAGPHDQHVGKRFGVWMGNVSELANEGFIVVRMDGKGTGKRCREFSHFAYKNVGDAGLPDRIKWMKDLAKEVPQMDLERVGIYGGSAGGQSSTGALIWHGDFYKAAVSDCGCHDNRMDKIWWNEQWMDWPVGPHYAEQSNVVNAGKLQGKLMLTVGEMDRNVDPASTMQVADALVKAGKDFEMYVIPGGGHGAGEKAFGRWKRLEFFLKHLGLPKDL